MRQAPKEDAIDVTHKMVDVCNAAMDKTSQTTNDVVQGAADIAKSPGCCL